MTFPATLVAPARSAYRAILRSARVTFADDQPRHAAFVSAIRPVFESPTLTDPARPPPPPLEGPAPDLSSEEEIRKRIAEWKEVADFLRKNVVQGRLEESGTYKLRVTEHTELGDNEDIRTPKPMPVTPFPNRGKRKCGE